MKVQYGMFIRRPFQALFDSMEYHYKVSEDLFKRVHAQDPSDSRAFDQKLWVTEKAESRAAFIMGMAGIEAFTNNVLSDFKLRNKEDLKEIHLSKEQKNKFIERWRLVDKVYFLPTLCNSKLEPPEFYFNKDSNEFRLFEELVQIRNSIMHGRPEPWKIKIKFRPDKNHEVYDSFEENFWPLSKIHKDFTSFNYECAKVAYDNIIWLKDRLMGTLERVERKYLIEEKIHLTTPILDEPESAERL